jgi:hypothetical protein
MNENPILLDKIPDSPTIYGVSAKHSEVMLYLTIKVELLDEGWLFASAHSIFLKTTNLYPLKTPEPTDLKLGYPKNIDGLQLNVRSHNSRFRNGSETDVPSRVKYSLIIEAGDKLLDEFEKISDTKNPSNFNSFIQFKLQ